MTPFRKGHDISSEQPPHARLPGTVLLLLAGRGGSPRQVVPYVRNVTQRNQKNACKILGFQLPPHVIRPARASVKSRREMLAARRRGYAAPGMPGRRSAPEGSHAEIDSNAVRALDRPRSRSSSWLGSPQGAGARRSSHSETTTTTTRWRGCGVFACNSEEHRTCEHYRRDPDSGPRKSTDTKCRRPAKVPVASSD